MFKWIFNIIKLLVLVIILFFASQFEYQGRKLYTYAKELPNSIIAQRAQYYIISILTGEKNPEKERKLFGAKSNNENKIDSKDTRQLKSIIIGNN